MKPNGILLPSIANLAVEKGAYLIFSANAKSTPGTLQRRIAAMRECIGDLPIQVDFWDAGRIASWVRMHPSIILWVRNAIGQSLVGWEPFGNWCGSAGRSTKFEFDEKARIVDTASENHEPVSIGEGMKRLIAKLSIPGQCVRLVGMSGVGKTRFVQALFEHTESFPTLNRDAVIYTDFSDSTDPTPEGMVEQLIALRNRLVLIIDNCSPKLHRRLVKKCSENTFISLLTVEYDVREDLPEETCVFLLGPSSDQLIFHLLSKRYTRIEEQILQRIVEFSNGNARIAFALADSVLEYGPAKGLKDAELFNRLFFQRDDPDRGLQRSAEYLAILYSFNRLDVSDKSELAGLAKLSSRDVSQLYSDENELFERKVVQRKGRWSAILPQAIADRLAKDAIRRTPPEFLFEILSNQQPRTILSFSRRISQLSEPAIAKGIVRLFFDSEDWFAGDLLTLTPFKQSIFENLAFVSQEDTLQRIEAIFEQRIRVGQQSVGFFLRILQTLAYEEKLFYRCVTILILACLHDSNNTGGARNLLKALFYRRFSFSLAPIDIRLSVIHVLFVSDRLERRKLSLELLAAALEAWHFRPRFNPLVGFSTTGFGLEYESADKLIEWYGKVMDLAAKFILTESTHSEQVGDVLAEKIRGIWLNARAVKEIDSICRKIREIKFWASGWVAIKTILRLDQERLPPNELVLASELESHLRPSCLEDRIRTYVLAGSRHSLDIADDEFDGDRERLANFLRSLGSELARDPASFDLLSHDLAVTSSYRLTDLAVGYYHGSGGNTSLWNIFAEFYDALPSGSSELRFLRGWLGACFDDNSTLGNELLDSFLSHPTYKQYTVTLQSAVPWSNDAWTRVKFSINANLVPVAQYSGLLISGRHNFFSDRELSYMVDALTVLNGHSFIIVALHNRFILNRVVLGDPDPTLVDAACRYFTVSTWFMQYKENRDYDFANAQTIEALYVLTNGGITFERLVRNVVDAILKDQISLEWFPYSLSMVALQDSQAFLSNFLLDTVFYTWCKRTLYIYDLRRSEHLLNQIEDCELIEWADRDAVTRYPLLFTTICLSIQTLDRIRWRDFVVVALSVKSIVNVLVEIMDDYVFLNPSLESMKRMCLLVKDLEEFTDINVVGWAKKAGKVLSKKIKDEEDSISRRNQNQEEEAFE